MIRALTIDFWNTIVASATGGAAREAQRMARLEGVIQACGGIHDARTLRAAYDAARARFDSDWRERHVTPSTDALVRCVWEALAVEVDDDDHRATVQVFEEGILHGRPELAPGFAEAARWAAGAGYALGIISDTMFSPGRVIRRLLATYGVEALFQGFVFSDEVGFSKPDARAFHQAADALGVSIRAVAHVGDLRRTDVRGAQAAGAQAILYTGVREDPGDGPDPDAHLPHWDRLPDVLQRLEHGSGTR